MLNGLLIVYQLFLPLLAYRKNIKLIKQKFTTSKEYDVIYYFNTYTCTFPGIGKIAFKYSEFRSITYIEKDNAILFRKNLKLETIIVLLDGCDEKKKEELFSIIPSLKKKY